MNILTGQILDVSNLLTIRVKAKQEDIQKHILELIDYAKKHGAKRCGAGISTTYSIDNQTMEMDIEFYFPIDKKIKSSSNIIFKDRLYLYNCVKINHKGNPQGLQATCNFLNDYIKNNHLIPISTGFNVNIVEILKLEDIDKFDVDIYVSVSQNLI